MPSTNSNKPATVATVNAELKRLGCAERLTRGRGYFYFRDGEALSWPSSSVYINDMDGTDVQWWLDEFSSLRAAANPASARHYATLKKARKHTPGPWQISDTDGGAICIHGDVTICGDGFKLTDADRALIAAAPALLAALAHWESFAKSNGYSTDKASPSYVSFLAETQAALAAARGGQ